jgi:hypothetical protein
MPAEVWIETTSRNARQYVLDQVPRLLRRSMREL